MLESFALKSNICRSPFRSTGKGFSYFDFILGVVVACGGAAFLEYRYNFRLLNRKQKAEAIQVESPSALNALPRVWCTNLPGDFKLPASPFWARESCRGNLMQENSVHEDWSR